MILSRDTTRLAWLTARIAEQKRRIEQLLTQMRGLTLYTSLEKMPPPILSKFFSLLGQVAEERNEEIRLLGRIEEIEAQHKFRRTHRQLEKATLEERMDAPAPDSQNKNEPPKSERLWWTFLLPLVKKKDATIE